LLILAPAVSSTSLEGSKIEVCPMRAACRLPVDFQAPAVGL
jgi:hypothetical protein